MKMSGVLNSQRNRTPFHLKQNKEIHYTQENIKDEYFSNIIKGKRFIDLNTAEKNLLNLNIEQKKDEKKLPHFDAFNNVNFSSIYFKYSCTSENAIKKLRKHLNLNEKELKKSFRAKSLPNQKNTLATLCSEWTCNEQNKNKATHEMLYLVNSNKFRDEKLDLLIKNLKTGEAKRNEDNKTDNFVIKSKQAASNETIVATKQKNHANIYLNSKLSNGSSYSTFTNHFRISYKDRQLAPPSTPINLKK
jgi:hypothetical protein